MHPFGTIVLARFPFTDLTGSKRRPALVVSHGTDDLDDIVVCFITSVNRTGRNMALLPSSQETGLKVDSRVRFDKIATLNRSVITGALGAAPAGWLMAQAPTFRSVFGF